MAAAVTWRTAAEPVTMAFDYGLPARVSPDSPLDCSEYSPDLDPTVDCVFQQPRSTAYPDADAVFILKPDDNGYNGIEIASFPLLSGLLTVEPGDRALSFEPAATAFNPDTREQASIVNIGFPFGESVNTYDGDWTYAGWIYGDITTREPFKSFVENRETFGFSASLVVDPDDGAPTSFRTDTHDQWIIVTFDDVPIEWVDVDITDFSAPVTDPPRSTSLLAIWGTTLGLVALVGGAGLTASRPLVGVANKAEEQGERLKQTAFGLAHDIRSPIRQMASAGERLGRKAEGRDKTMTDQIVDGAAELRATLDKYAEITGGGADLDADSGTE